MGLGLLRQSVLVSVRAGRGSTSSGDILRLDTKFLELLLQIIDLLLSLLSLSRELFGSLLICRLHRRRFLVGDLSNLGRHRFLSSFVPLLRLGVNVVRMTVAIDGNVVNECLGGFVKLLPEKAFEEIA